MTMAQVLIETIRTRDEVERQLRRGAPIGDAPGPGASGPGRRPDWLKVRVRHGKNFAELRDITWVDLPTSHWPMWSRPRELAEIIGDVAKAHAPGA